MNWIKDMKEEIKKERRKKGKPQINNDFPETYVHRLKRVCEQLSEKHPRWKCRWINTDKEIVFISDAKRNENKSDSVDDIITRINRLEEELQDDLPSRRNKQRR